MEEKNRKIVDAAVELFSEKGYNKTTMQEIAETAGVGKGTIYRFFKSKDEMVSSLLEVYIEDIAERIRKAISKVSDPIEKMKSVIQVELDYYDENRNFARFMIREAWGTQKRFIEHIRKIKETRASLVEEILFQGMEQNVFKKVDSDTIAASLEGMILASSVHWFIFSDEYPKETIRENIDTLFFEGILV